jgi:predicted nucleotide-binding protein
MASRFASDLDKAAERLRSVAAAGSDETIAEPLRRLQRAAISVGEAWSGSPIGYQSRVYYADFAPRPADALWSSEWGMTPAFSNTAAGDWQIYTRSAVVEEVHSRAGNPDMAAATHLATQAKRELDEVRAEIRSVLTAFLSERSDELLKQLKERVDTIKVHTADQLAHAALPTGQYMSRDSQAMSEGLQVAPHLSVLADVLAVQSAFQACADLGDVAAQAGAHIRRLGSARHAAAVSRGSAVFIGHGRSAQWRELKDFIQDRLGLPWEEFNRMPAAGVTNIARLAEMLEASTIAFLVLTAEDEMADGTVIARQNVIHEAGLFQGRLGFTRAIVVLEEGCESFSNIDGLGQIRFPRGRIAAAFEEVRRVLEREGLLTAAGATPAPS